MWNFSATYTLTVVGYSTLNIGIRTSNNYDRYQSGNNELYVGILTSTNGTPVEYCYCGTAYEYTIGNKYDYSTTRPIVVSGNSVSVRDLNDNTLVVQTLSLTTNYYVNLYYWDDDDNRYTSLIRSSAGKISKSSEKWYALVLE